MTVDTFVSPYVSDLIARAINPRMRKVPVDENGMEIRIAAEVGQEHGYSKRVHLQ